MQFNNNLILGGEKINSDVTDVARTLRDVQINYTVVVVVVVVVIGYILL